MEKCGNLFCSSRGGFRLVASERATEIVRANGSMKLQACSACAGDYEDPERTAGEEFEKMLAGDEVDDADSRDND